MTAVVGAEVTFVGALVGTELASVSVGAAVGTVVGTSVTVVVAFAGAVVAAVVGAGSFLLPQLHSKRHTRIMAKIRFIQIPLTL